MATTSAHADAAVNVLDDVRSTPFDQLGKDPVCLTTGVVIHVGRLTLNQILSVGRVGTRTLVSTTDEQMAAITAGNWAALLALLDDDTIEAVLGVVLGRHDGRWLDELDVVDLGKIAEAIVAHNDPAPLIRVFSQAVSKRSSPTSTPSSDQPV